MVVDRRGFTLVEIMDVIVILGILASVAIGLTMTFREKAFISSIESDLSNALKVSAVFYSDSPDGELTLVILEANGFSASRDVIINVVDGEMDTLRITATHPSVIGTYEVDKAGNIFKQ